MIHPHIAALLSHPAIRSMIEKALAARGSHGDTMLAHIGPGEANMLRQAGGVGTTNPRTGLPQFYDAQGASGASASTGQNDTGMGTLDRGGIGGIIDRIGNAIGGLANNFGEGWGSRGVAGGYGNATGGGPNTGGGGFGRPGEGGINFNSPYLQRNAPPMVVPSQPINPLPSQAAPPPVDLAPLMSQGAPNLTGGAFGPLPAWATAPYEIAQQPTSFPTPGVNPAIGWPTTGGGMIPGGTVSAPGTVPSTVPGDTAVLGRGQHRAGNFPLAGWLGLAAMLGGQGLGHGLNSAPRAPMGGFGGMPGMGAFHPLPAPVPPPQGNFGANRW